jgi:phenylacetic acid degradation operon negative regulatory protein
VTPIRPLTARSAVLSLLLGAHPPELAARQIVRAAESFGIADATLRVALTRMVAAGDLERADGTYRLSPRLLERQARQDAALGLRTKAWRGGWAMVVVTATGRGAGERAQLRDELARMRFGELREGVWLRPDNLRHDAPSRSELATFTVRPVADAGTLAGALWDLAGWADAGRELLVTFRESRSDAGLRLAVAAAIVRHLLTDPLLPDELLPARWPSERLRTTYAAYQGELMALARSVRDNG